MSTEQLKELLIAKIDDINDEETLIAIYKLIDQEASKTPFQLTEEMKAAIQIGRQQIKAGEFITNEELNEEIDQWLGKE